MTKTAVAILVAFIAVLAAYFLQPERGIFIMQTRIVPELSAHEHDIHEDTIDSAGHHEETLSRVVRTQKDLWVTSIDFTNVHASSSALHHAFLTTSSTSSWSWCSDKPDDRFFAIFTEDSIQSPIRFPYGYALHIPAGTPLVLYAMYHNTEPPVGPGTTYHDVFSRIILHTQEPSALYPLKPLRFYAPHLADDPCLPNDAGYFFKIPPNTPEYRFDGKDAKVHTERITFESPTTIRYWGGHVHGWQGGKDLLVKKNGQVIQDFKTARVDGDPYQFETPQGPADIPFLPGDTLSLEALYENSSAQAYVGAMGALYMYVSDE